MIHKSVSKFAICFIVVMVAAAGLRAQESKPQPPTDVYKVDYIFSEFQDSKRVNARSYMVLVRAGEKASIRLGSRVPIVTGIFPPGSSKEGGNPLVQTQYQYLDIGMNIDCHLDQPTDSGIALVTNVDVSRIAPVSADNGTGQPTVRQTKIELHSIVPLGKQTVLTSADEVDGTGRFQVEVTVTKVR